MLLLVLLQVAFLTVTLLTLVAFVFQFRGQMAALVDIKTTFVSCSVVTLVTLKRWVFNVLPSDVYLKGLCAITHLLAYGASLVALVDAT